MANNDYSIPWQPLDISGGARFLLGAMNTKREQERADENARTQRMFAEKNLAVASAQAKRDEQEFQRKLAEAEHRKAVERSQQFGPLSAAARRYGPAYATEMGKPFGIGFDEQAAPQERVRPDLFGAANNALGDFARKTLESPAQPPVEDPNALDAVSGGAPIIPPVEQPAGPDLVAEETARLSEPQQRRLMMNVNGQSFPIPEVSASTGLGPEYDQMFQRFVEMPGVSEEDALKLVFQEHKSARSQEAIANRTASSIEARKELAATHRPDVETLEKWLEMRLAQSDKNSRRSASAKIQAAGSTSSPMLAELLRLKEEGAPDSEVAALAAASGIPSRAWTMPVKEAGRQTEKHSQLTVTGPDGEVLGEAHDPVAKRRLDDANIAFTQLVERTKALAEDVKKNGARIMPWDFAGQQRRESLKAAAASAGRKYHELGVSNANVELEHQILGPSGTLGDGFVRGANANVIDETLKEAEVKHKAGMAVRLRSGEAGNRVQPQMPKKRPAKRANLPGHGKELPPGAIPGKLNGRRGYVLNGEFHPTE